jgi:uncharacterized membrane protein YuzA (DUF378 family)
MSAGLSLYSNKTQIKIHIMKGLHMVTFILLIIGGLNWGLEALGVGIGNYIPGGLATLIYALVGISAVVELVTHKKCCTACKAKGGGSAMPMQGGSNEGGGM